MRAIILAAGVGRRLQAHTHQPKCLLAFNDYSLMQRHIDTLAKLGVDEISLCLGFEADTIVSAIDVPNNVRLTTRLNPDFREGSMISLWTMRKDLRSGEEIILMDADVLYQPEILNHLVKNEDSDLLLLDREFEAGEEPVKICLDRGRIVEFRKLIDETLSFDSIGESVGFFRFSAEMSVELADYASKYLDRGEREAPAEEAIRDLVLDNQHRFQAHDITGLRWIEIDFPEDIKRAKLDVLPFVD